MADTKMSEKLWRDCKSDQERADFILCGRAHETGVIATSIQSEVAMAFQRLATMKATPPADAPRRTNRELHEEAAGMNLADSFFTHSGIDPNGYPPADAALADLIAQMKSRAAVILDKQRSAQGSRETYLDGMCTGISVCISIAESATLRARAVADGIWVREFVDAVEREAFKMRAPNTHTPVLVGMCIEARRRLLSASKGNEPNG